METVSEEGTPPILETPKNDPQELGGKLVRFGQRNCTEQAAVESNCERYTYGGQWAVMLENALRRKRRLPTKLIFFDAPTGHKCTKEKNYRVVNERLQNKMDCTKCYKSY